MKIAIAAAGAVLVLASAWTGTALAQRAEPLPKQLEGVGITEHPDAQIPLDVTFNDENGRPVRIRDFLRGDKPAILTLVYYECPMLCTLVLNGLVDSMRQLAWTPGKEFEVVTVSFNPRETPELARAKKASYLASYGREGAQDGWHFLTGDDASIHAITSAVGFQYHWDDEQKMFAHQAAIFVLTPDGRLSRYLYGVLYEPKTVKLALLEAGRGKIGTTVDQIVLFCYHYDPDSGSYAPAAMRIMRAGGALTLLLFGGWLSLLWIRGARRKPKPGEPSGSSGGIDDPAPPAEGGSR